jgi:hypothetical protein
MHSSSGWTDHFGQASTVSANLKFTLHDERSLWLSSGIKVTTGASYIAKMAGMGENHHHHGLFGLQALDSLDAAVNGTKPAPPETSTSSSSALPAFRQLQPLDSSGNSAEYSPQSTLKRGTSNGGGNTAMTGVIPPKPPRKAPSVSPPSLRRGTSVLSDAPPHYSQPQQVQRGLRP